MKRHNRKSTRSQRQAGKINSLVMLSRLPAAIILGANRTSSDIPITKVSPLSNQDVKRLQRNKRKYNLE